MTIKIIKSTTKQQHIQDIQDIQDTQDIQHSMTDVKTNRKRTPLKEDTTKFPKKSRCIKTNKPRPYLCPICTRGFVRHEHLKRHQRSHTRERPFLCVLCGRCFARKDLVIRHQQKLHPFLMDDSNQLLNNDSNEIIMMI